MTNFIKFQSIPAPKGWWNIVFIVVWGEMLCFNPYQPRKAGEIWQVISVTCWVVISFNPYQPRKAGEMHRSRGNGSWKCEFQSIPAPKGWWNDRAFYAVYALLVVSIHTSPERLVKYKFCQLTSWRGIMFQSIPAPKGWWNCFNWFFSSWYSGELCFNPYQPRKAGEIW